MFDGKLEKYFEQSWYEDERLGIAYALRLAQEGELLRSASLMSRLLAKSPESLDILYNYGKICYAIYSDKSNEMEMKADFKDVSRTLFETCTIKHPGFAGAYYYLGFFYLNNGLYEKASLIWKSFLKLALPADAEEVKEVSEQMELLGDLVSFERGYLAVLAGQSDKGLLLLEPLLKKDESAWNIMYFMGLAYRQKGDFEKAAGLLLKVLAKRPSLSEAMNELGICYAAIGDFTKAEKYLKKALLIKENDPEILFNLAGLYIRYDKLDKADEHLRLAMSIAPEDDIGKSWKKELERKLECSHKEKTNG